MFYLLFVFKRDYKKGTYLPKKSIYNFSHQIVSISKIFYLKKPEKSAT
jgi:hypothetical protein